MDRSLSPRYAFLDIRIDKAKLAAVERAVRGIPGAMARLMPPALNQAAAQMRTWLYRQFAERMSIARKSSIRDRLAISPKATPANWSAGVRIELKRFTVASFKGVRQLKAGVRWSPRPGVMNLIPRAFLTGGFTHYASGEYVESRQVWRRAEEGGRMVPRYPIHVLKGPSLARVFSDDPSFQGQAEQAGAEIVSKKLDQQVSRIVKT